MGGFFERAVDPTPLVLLNGIQRIERNLTVYRVHRLRLVFHAVILCFMLQLNLVSHYI